MTEKTPDTPRTQEDSPEFTIPDGSAGFKLAEESAWFLLEKKAEDISILDLRGSSDVCDFFVIAEGNSDVQVKALARHLRDRLLERGHRPLNIEGLDEGRWALLDFFDVIIHVFQGETRRYYQLERLWNDARRLDLNADWYRDAQVADRHPGLDFIFAPGAKTQGS